MVFADLDMDRQIGFLKQTEDDMEDIRSIRRTHITRFKWLYLIIIVVPVLAYIPMLYGYPERTSGIKRSVSNHVEPFFGSNFHNNTKTYAFFDPRAFLNHNIPGRNKPKRPHSNRSYLNQAKTQRDRYMPIILEAASRYQVDPAIILAIIKAESNYDPYAVSRAGAVGLMQLMPRTARELGVRNSFNPEQNIHGGVKYFSQLIDKFSGDHALALAAYNAGSRKVLEHKGIPPYYETRQYIKRVFKYRKQFKQKILKNG